LAKKLSKTDPFPTGSDIKPEIKLDTMLREDIGEEPSWASTK